MAKNRQNQVEILTLQDCQHNLTKKALKMACGYPYHIKNESITIEDPEDGVFRVLIKPTSIGFLFDFFRYYGKLCASYELEE